MTTGRRGSRKEKLSTSLRAPRRQTVKTQRNRGEKKHGTTCDPTLFSRKGLHGDLNVFGLIGLWEYGSVERKSGVWGRGVMVAGGAEGEIGEGLWGRGSRVRRDKRGRGDVRWGGMG